MLSLVEQLRVRRKKSQGKFLDIDEGQRNITSPCNIFERESIADKLLDRWPHVVLIFIADRANQLC
jgi:hypothetical protein